VRGERRLNQFRMASSTRIGCWHYGYAEHGRSHDSLTTESVVGARRGGRMQ
jgi:hypothetical protein